jgi:hypothetical protein
MVPAGPFRGIWCLPRAAKPSLRYEKSGALGRYRPENLLQKDHKLIRHSILRIIIQDRHTAGFGGGVMLISQFR